MITSTAAEADPYGDIKVYHLVKFLSDRGQASALCYDTPRAIRGKCHTWTNRPEAVTCPKCKERIGKEQST